MLKRARRSGVAALLALSCVLIGQVPLLAQTGLYPPCPFVLHEKQLELDDLELLADLAQTRLETATRIFDLLDGLWNNDAVERLDYLREKHHRDAARVKVERARWRVDRQHAIVKQYSLVCSALSDEEPASDTRRALEQAYRRYLESDCEIRALDLQAVEVDLVHHRETLASVLELRKNAVASLEQVIRAESDVELMEKRLQKAKQRAVRCRREILARSGAQQE